MLPRLRRDEADDVRRIAHRSDVRSRVEGPSSIAAKNIRVGGDGRDQGRSDKRHSGNPALQARHRQTKAHFLEPTVEEGDKAAVNREGFTNRQWVN